MGRLDDIIQRNREALNGGRKGPAEHRRALIDVVNDLGQKPSPEVPPFTLPSQRQPRTPVWKVVLIMLLMGAIAAAVLVGEDLAKRDDAATRP